MRHRICRRNPALTATIIDRPEVLEAARANIISEGVGDRLSAQAADLRSDEFGSGQDVALLFRVLHGFSPEENVGLLQRVAKVLVPGGLVVILENDPRMAPGPVTKAFGGILGLGYASALGGPMYTLDEIGRWLTQAGFGPSRRIALRRVLGGLVIAKKLGRPRTPHGSPHARGLRQDAFSADAQ